MTTQQGTATPGNTTKTNKFGGGATFNGPSFGLNVNVNKTQPGAFSNPGEGVGRTSALVLPEPAFYSPADIRSYTEAVRAAGAYLAIEIEVGAMIMKAALEQVSGPDDRPFTAKMRARRVARRLEKTASEMAAAAAQAAATWSAFQREYSDMMALRRQAATQGRPFDLR